MQLLYHMQTCAPTCRPKFSWCDISEMELKRDEIPVFYRFLLENHVDETVQTSNTKVIVDNVPLWIWSFLGFITLSICGWIFFAKYREDYPERSKSAKSGAIAFYIFAGSCLVIYLLYLYLKSQGKIQ